MISELEPNEVDLTSFEIQDTLNPAIWDDTSLIPEVRKKLILIANEFWDSLELDWVKPIDYILVGSSCNYNWSVEFSDLDLHIVVSYKDVDDNTEMVEKFFKTKSREWNNAHKELQMNDVPVEIYVQDQSTPADSKGEFSLLSNKWVHMPEQSEIGQIDINDTYIKDQIAEVATIIEGMIKFYEKATSDKEYSHLYDKVLNLIEKLVTMRHSALEKDGEMAKDNIVFKSLKRNDYLNKLYELSDRLFDKLYSVPTK